MCIVYGCTVYPLRRFSGILSRKLKSPPFLRWCRLPWAPTRLPLRSRPLRSWRWRCCRRVSHLMWKKKLGLEIWESAWHSNEKQKAWNHCGRSKASNSTYHGTYVLQIAFSLEKISKTVTRFLQSFALPDKVVQLQLTWRTLRRNQPQDGSICLSPPKRTYNERFARQPLFHDVWLKKHLTFHNGFIFLLHLLSIYIFMYIYVIVNRQGHNNIRKCNCVGANKPQHMKMHMYSSHCMWLNPEPTKISNRYRIRICWLINSKSTRNRSNWFRAE